MPDPFATASEMAQFAGMAEPADLARMQLLLDLASAEIRSVTGQVCSVVTNDTVELGPTLLRTLYLPERPVTAVSGLVENGVALTAYTFTARGAVVRGTTAAAYTSAAWPYGATVTYDHGWAEGSTEYQRIKAVCIEAALRAYGMNREGASEAMGPVLMESAGYAPELFLTEGERRALRDLMQVGIG